MPSEAISLALACSIYPPALAAVIALGRGAQVRLRVLVLVVAAFFTALTAGLLTLFLFKEAAVTSRQARSAGAGLYLAAGVVLIWLAVHLRNRDRDGPKTEAEHSKLDRYLESTRLVGVLGVALYAIPSPIFVGLVRAIAHTHASTAQEILYLVQALLIMLWMIELPMLVLLAFPARGAGVLESINAWLGRNGRVAAVVVAGGAGLYLIGVGLTEIL